MSKAGFTLIEVLIYLALFSLVFSGLLVSAFSIIENTGRSAAQVMAQSEAEFMLSKMGWAMNSAESFEIVPPGLLKINGARTYIFKEESGRLEMNGLPLNNSATHIINLQFGGSGNGADIGFTLRARAGDGKLYSRDFKEKFYLKK